MASSMIIEQVVQSQAPSAAHQFECIERRRGRRRCYVNICRICSSGRSNSGSSIGSSDSSSRRGSQNCVGKLLIRHRNGYMLPRSLRLKAFIEPCVLLNPFESDAVLWTSRQDLTQQTFDLPREPGWVCE